MNRPAHWTTRLVCSWLMLAACLSVAPAPAQERPRERGRIQITDLDFEYMQQPAYRGAASIPGARAQHDWLQIRLKYDSEGGRDGWIDNVSLSWAVFMRPKDGGRPFVLRQTIAYVDVEDSRNHLAVVYIRPGFIRRYYGDKRIDAQDVAVYIEAKVDGVTSDRKHFTRGRVPREWWEVDDPRRANIKTDELLARTDTPFGPLDYDSYEHIKPPVSGQ